MPAVEGLAALGLLRDKCEESQVVPAVAGLGGTAYAPEKRGFIS
jgi:hypothetical protein